MSTKIIQVKVKPNARTAALSEQPDGSWVAQVRSPPADGRANAELIALVAERFAVRRAAITIRSGRSGRMKLIQIELR